MDAAERRLARVAAHLVPSFPVTHAATFPLVPASTAAFSSSSSSSSPAGDSYRRVHGDVPSEPPEWRAATDESGKEFVDIIYEKAVGEGIAKVTRSSSIGYPCVKFWAPGKKKNTAAGSPGSGSSLFSLHFRGCPTPISAADHYKPA
jgi:hypothetical protein